MFRKMKRILPVIGIIILVYIILRIDVGTLIRKIIVADPVYLLLALVMLITHLAIQTLKWKFLLGNQNISVGFLTLLRIQMIGVFYSVLTPGKLGTLIRIAYLKEETKKDIGVCTPSVIIDRMLDILAMLVLAIMGMVILVRYMTGGFIPFILAAFLIVIASFVFLMKKNLSRWPLKTVYRLAVPAKYRQSAKTAFKSFHENLPGNRTLVIPALLTMLSWTISYTSIYFVALSVGFDIPYYIFITTMPIATIVGLIPITISGWGTREATMIFLFSIFAISAESVISLSIVAFVIIGLIPALVGALTAFVKTNK